MVLFVGLILSLIILAGFWLACGRLDSAGLGFLAWNRTPARQLLKAVGGGVVAALVVSWVFRDLEPAHFRRCQRSGWGSRLVHWRRN